MTCWRGQPRELAHLIALLELILLTPFVTDRRAVTLDVVDSIDGRFEERRNIIHSAGALPATQER